MLLAHCNDTNILGNGHIPPYDVTTTTGMWRWVAFPRAHPLHIVRPKDHPCSFECGSYTVTISRRARWSRSVASVVSVRRAASCN